MKKQAWIVAYDITDKKRLGRVHRLLKKEATPIQYSIFYYEGNVNELKSLLNDIEERINNKTDDVRAYCLPNNMKYNAIGVSALSSDIGLFSEVNNELARFLGYDESQESESESLGGVFMLI